MQRLPRVHGSYLPRVGAAQQIAELMASSYTAPTSAYAAGNYAAQLELAKQAAIATATIDTPPNREELFLPATQDTVTVGAHTITVVPACDFEVRELTVPANAGNFEITSLRVGMRPLLAADGPIPAAMFAPNSLASRACAGLVKAGTPIQIGINCLVQSDFRAVFSGSGLV